MGRVLFVSALLFLFAFPRTASAQVETDFRDCVSAAAQEARIEACTRIIDNPNVQGRRTAIAFIERGRAHWLRGALKLALVDLDQAAELLPNNFRPYYERGLVHHDMRNYELAIRDYTAAVKLDPQYVNAYNNLGLSYEKIGNKEIARTHYDAAINLRPNNNFALMRRGFVTASSGSYEAALVDYDASIKAEPRQLLSRVYRAETYERLNRLQDAAADYQAVIDAPSVRPGVRDDALAKRLAAQRIEGLQRKIAAALSRTTQAERRVALVLGNTGYAHAGALKNPENDAKAVAKVLKDFGLCRGA